MAPRAKLVCEKQAQGKRDDELLSILSFSAVS